MTFSMLKLVEKPRKLRLALVLALAAVLAQAAACQRRSLLRDLAGLAPAFSLPCVSEATR